MLMFARNENRKRFVALCKSAQVTNSFPINSLEFDELVSEERIRFCTRLLVAGAARGSSCNQQLYFYQMVASFRGLSRTGSTVLQLFGCGLNIRTYDKFRKAHQRRITDELR
jgi:hypothetical protein